MQCLGKFLQSWPLRHVRAQGPKATKIQQQKVQVKIKGAILIKGEATLADSATCSNLLKPSG
jgi:hypothetical protein